MLPLRPRKATSTRVNEAERIQAIVADAEDRNIPIAIDGVNKDTTGAAQHSGAVIKAFTIFHDYHTRMPYLGVWRSVERHIRYDEVDLRGTRIYEICDKFATRVVTRIVDQMNLNTAKGFLPRRRCRGRGIRQFRAENDRHTSRGKGD